jgi:hypothetical protein
MDCSPEQATVVYRSKDGKEKKTYDALEWLAAMACHVPERRKQTIRLCRKPARPGQSEKGGKTETPIAVFEQIPKTKAAVAGLFDSA